MVVGLLLLCLFGVSGGSKMCHLQHGFENYANNINKTKTHNYLSNLILII